MTSEIRTNTLTSRAGLSTVTLTDSGPMFSGITTFVDNSTFSVGTGGTIHAPATNVMALGTNNIDAIKIDSSGNVNISGILTASSISGGVSLTNGSNNRVVTATGAAALTGESGLTFDGSTLNLTSASGDARVTVIGTEGNDARLSLVSDDGDDHIDQYNLRVAASDNRFYIDQFESGAFQERFTIANGGNIGIGTDNPAKKLEVFDTTQGVIRIRGGAGGSNSSRKADLSLFASGAREYVVRADASDAAFKIVDVSGSNAERLTITSGGQIRLPVNGQQLTWGASQQFKMYWENSEDRMYLQGDGAYGMAFRINGGNRLEINKTTGDVTMQGASGRNFNWDNSEASLYLTDNGSGASARLKIGTGADLQLYHDVGGDNHIVCANNQPLKVSANEFRVYDYTGVTHYMRIDNAGRLLLGGTAPELNEKMCIRGRYVNASTTTLNFNTSGSLGSSLQIRSSDSGANSIGLIEFNQGGLKSAIGSGRANAGNWGTDLRFYTHPDTTNNIHESYERLRILPSSQIRHTRSDNTTRYDVEFRQAGGLSNGNYGGIHWTQGSSGNTNLAAIQIAYQNSGQPDFVFYTRQTGGNSMEESVRFTHEGDLCLNQNTNDARLGIKARGSNSNIEFITCRNTSSTLKMYVHHSGNLYNTNGNYSQISDQSLKENIVDANSQWDDIKNIRIRNFNFTAASGMDTHTQIGCVAQEVETVSPKLVSAPKDGVKTVANSVLYMKAVKALQEAMTRIETLEQENIALRARVTNLEGN